MATLKGFNDPEVQTLMEKHNGQVHSPNVDRNLMRAPDRYIHVFSTSPREFKIDRAPLWLKLILKRCPVGERYIEVMRIPDPLMQAVHDVSTGKQRGEANDGMLCAVELLNPNNPTYNPDYEPPAEIAAVLGTSQGCNLFEQGLFLSLNEKPTEDEISRAEARRERRYKRLIAHADSLEATNRAELEDFLKSGDGVDLRMALDAFSEHRSYHQPRVATRSCPNCGDAIKKNQGFHRMPDGEYCVNDWRKAVDAGIKTKFDVPEDARWFTLDEPKPAAAPKPAKKRNRAPARAA